jgi:glycosyltransferase involved in cell wall biosynthesis
MRIAVLIREHDPLSLVRYRDNVTRELELLGTTLLPFTESDPIPLECDLFWDPGMGRNRHPFPAFRNLKCPVVITLHGSATFTMKWYEVYSGLLEAIRDKWANVAAMREWTWFRNKVSAVIAVSRYGAWEASLVYNILPDLVTPIYHGVDRTVFFPENNLSNQTAPYFLHVSSYQPLKNLNRLIDAYAQLPVATRPKLIVVAPGFVNKKPLVSGISIIQRPLASSELAKLYSNALAFIFPSLRESFGLPIVEAMACGCPVITSFDTACAEVAGNAALLVNPRSIGNISHAMSRLINEPDLRTEMSQQGLARASQFSWSETARLHMAVFMKAIK